MAIKMPSVSIVFKQLATTLIERSERGIVVLIVRDDTNKDLSVAGYNTLSAVNEEDYTADNYAAIKDVFTYALNKVYVVRLDSEGSMSEALNLIDKNITTGWITVVNGTTTDFTDITSWIKSKELAGKTYKAVVYDVSATDCKHLVNFGNKSVTFADDRGTQPGSKFLPTLVGIFASCNIKKGATWFKCQTLTSVEEAEDNDAALAQGKLILVNDVDYVRIANAINSLITLDGKTATEDMRYIDTVEAMDIITDDISSTFRNEYMGSFRNSYDNQILLISSIKAYLKELAKDDVLDSLYNNTVDVDVDAQRDAWLGTGKAEAETWSDQQVKNNAFKRTVFLKGDIKILGSMDNLEFTIMLM